MIGFLRELSVVLLYGRPSVCDYLGMDKHCHFCLSRPTSLREKGTYINDIDAILLVK